jgi:hypothetical protein
MGLFEKPLNVYVAIVEAIKALGYVGGLVGVFYGFFLIVIGLQVWNFSSTTSFRQLLQQNAKDEMVIIGCLILVAGGATLSWQSGRRAKKLMNIIHVFKETGKIDGMMEKLCKAKILGTLLGEDVTKRLRSFEDFTSWAEQNGHIDAKSMKSVRKAYGLYKTASVKK